TTDAFRRVVAGDASIGAQLDRLAGVDLDDRDAIGTISAEIRRSIEAIPVPDGLATAITDALSRIGEDTACAVRSSATAEDLPTASFAGQQDSYLDVVGPAAILRHVSRCWASLFTDRAVTYRLRNGVDHRKVHMAVVVQQMVLPHAAGVLFTAHPVTGHRRVATVEAGLGLGEALVAGLVDPDAYEVHDGVVTARTAGTEPALTDDQVLRLVELGRTIEAHMGCPQDIEWCLADDRFHIVQSRPITTLFPIPAADDGDNHVYVSVGHQQMMTDPIKPLGLSVWKHTAPRPMPDAGGRLFVDVTHELASPATRDRILMLGASDPLIGDALRTIVDREGFLPPAPDDGPVGPPPGAAPTPAPIETDPAIVTELIERTQASIAASRREIEARSGVALLDAIEADFGERLRQSVSDPRSMQVIMAAMEATSWLNDNLETWLGERNAADTLTQSVPHNVTSEMGLALLDVADAIRPHPEVVAFLEQVDDDAFLEQLPTLAGGQEALAAIEAFLDRYGMRGVGEIDITRPRWSERPRTLVSLILGNVRTFEPGAGARRFERGRQEALAKAEDVLSRLRALPDGDQKADETERMIDRVRTFAGYREYPKYGIVCRYFVYKQALLEEADRLVQAGLLREREDVFYLSLAEIRDVVAGTAVDDALVEQRKEAFASYAALTPPRVLTSDGEVISGTYGRDDVPAGALVGLAVSAGTIEGRARVVHDISVPDLRAGDILVTAHTDPSWSPLFVSIAGLVTEVGGLMTHGAVVAREYGLPAVVGVERATQRIEDGQRIRVHGTDGYVELVS
ncbi:MAG TPA: rifamycin-inactivating phosphotransferase, partial [Iamia sp.]